MVARELETINLIDLQSVDAVYNIMKGNSESLNNWEKGLNVALEKALTENPNDDFDSIIIKKFTKEYVDPNQVPKNTLMVFFDDCANKDDRSFTENYGAVKIITGIRGRFTEQKTMYIHACIEYLLRRNCVPKFEFTVKGRNYYVPARPGSTEIKVGETILEVRQEVHLR